MASGVRLALDIGKARIGVARSDPHGMLAVPCETVARDPDGDTDLARILELVDEYDAVEIVVGLPLNMRGEHTPSTDDAERFARALAEQGLSVRLVDERLSTVTAHAQLRQTGKTSRTSKGIIDQAAAVVILQHALDTERQKGDAGGKMLRPTDTDETSEGNPPL